MITFPNAKINLGLNVIERRQDNFHNLETVFYPIPWKDILEILPAPQFEFKTSGIQIAGDTEDNLCVKVYRGLQHKYSLPPVSMHLHKIIPTGAGLGGGSSDAAFTLKILNELFELNLTSEVMENFIRPYGSDCAFFVRNEPVFASGKGDLFEAISLTLTGKWIVIVYPGLHISTKEAYSGVVPARPQYSIREIIKTPLNQWKDFLVNDFEKSIFPNHPELSGLKDQLYRIGALYASMSGSGSAMFGIFEKEIILEGLFPENYLTCTGTLN